jgi:hypothetical protein
MKLKVVASLLIALSLVATLPCCNRAPSISTEDEHEEHEHFPMHWPGSIFAAMDRLDLLMSGQATPVGDGSISLEQELLDLIRWLPELIADSDLDEATFNNVDTWTSELVPLMEKELQQKKTLDAMRQVDGLAHAISELKNTVEIEKKRLEAR